MFGILGLGFLLGMRHALEADHIAAIGATTIYTTAFA
jgi:high-affinity nickel permease